MFSLFHGRVACEEYGTCEKGGAPLCDSPLAINCLHIKQFACHKLSEKGTESILLTTFGGGEHGWCSGESALPPTGVACVRFWLGVIKIMNCVGQVCWWFSSLFQAFFSRYSGFSPITKTNISKL